MQFFFVDNMAKRQSPSMFRLQTRSILGDIGYKDAKRY
jgi:hypothetical protein